MLPMTVCDVIMYLHTGSANFALKHTCFESHVHGAMVSRNENFDFVVHVLKTLPPDAPAAQIEQHFPI
jgi:hypothetical protein